MDTLAADIVIVGSAFAAHRAAMAALAHDARVGTGPFYGYLCTVSIDTTYVAASSLLKASA